MKGTLDLVNKGIIYLSTGAGFLPLTTGLYTKKLVCNMMYNRCHISQHEAPLRQICSSLFVMASYGYNENLLVASIATSTKVSARKYFHTSILLNEKM